jgi:hypothetical protein
MSSIVETINQQRDAFLDSPALSEDWKHGWHAAVGHVAYTVEQEHTNVQIGGVEFSIPQAVAIHIAKIEAALFTQPSPATAWQEGHDDGWQSRDNYGDPDYTPEGNPYL